MATKSITINLAQSYTPEANSSTTSNLNWGDATSNGNNVKLKSKEDDHIKVICRFRPKNTKEQAEEKRQGLVTKKTIQVYGNKTALEIPRRDKRKPSLHFTLDSIIWSDIPQSETFHLLAQKSVAAVVEGYNSTIFAFGQTGSGKTYTMFGPETLTNVEELGIIPRSVDYLFKLLNEDKNIMKFQISLSIVEVYKEILRDLLISEKEKKNRKRLEVLSAGKEIRVKNCTEKACVSVNDILKYIVLAQSNRAKHTTDFIGHDSSRSHCVVMISLTQRLMDDSIKFSKLNFGDLAGSELASKTGTKQSNLKEAGKIHQGLLALENVINALVEKKKHVPYNDSKLTRLLSTSIGGNSKTTLLVTCSPSIWNRDETVSTLRFAQRAKKIKNTAKINKRKTREQLEARIAYLENENRELKQKLNKKKYGGNAKAVTMNMKKFTEEKEKYEALMTDKDAEIKRLKDLVGKKNDALTQFEEDFQAKNGVVNELDQQKNDYLEKCKKLNKTLSEKNARIRELQEKLDTKIEFESKLQDHTKNLQNIVNNSNSKRNDVSSSMGSALTEITQQQNDFYGFLKTIADSVEKLHEKHDKSEKKRDGEVNDLKQMILSIETDLDMQRQQKEQEAPLEEEYERDRELSVSRSELNVTPTTPGSNDGRMGHYAGQSSLGFDLSFASGQLMAERDENEKTKSNLSELITSMRSYLEKANANEGKEKEKEKNEPFALDLMDVISNPQVNEFNIGKEVDVLDVSYTWYSANIVDIDVFDKKAVFIKYDAFEDNWNEWIPLKNGWRIATHKSRTDVADSNPFLKGENDGIHCMVATKYGRSKGADHIQQVFSSENTVLNYKLSTKSVLMQGYLYKESPSKFRKTNWKRLWFVVKNNETIYYYDHKNMKSKQHRGAIRLAQISIVQIAKQKGFTSYSFDIITHKRKMRRFSCNNEQDLVDWMSVLQCLVYSDCHQIQASNKESTDLSSIRNVLSINRNSIVQYFTDEESDFKDDDQDDSAFIETID